ncbi:MAG: SRPBCC domain-containing protein [Bacteroidota bacterium]|nr:SRPBCC domain-containing protein [Bacteroidota bacterium]
MATSHDWSRFTVRINVNAPVEKLYHAWVTRSGMESWFLRLSEYKKPGGSLRGNNELVEKGDSYKWLWHGYADETAEYGEILDVNGKDLFKFSFGKAGNCTVKIYKEDHETIVELAQDNIPADEEVMYNWHVGCKTGWTFYLANMKSVYEGGIDLRNKNVNLQQVLNS